MHEFPINPSDLQLEVRNPREVAQTVTPALGWMELGRAEIQGHFQLPQEFKSQPGVMRTYLKSAKVGGDMPSATEAWTDMRKPVAVVLSWKGLEAE